MSFSFDTTKTVSYISGAEKENDQLQNVSVNGAVYKVVRLTFTTGDVGASSFSFSIKNVTNDENAVNTATGEKFAFAISDTSEESIAKYRNYNGPGDGVITFEKVSGINYDISGSVADKVLAPNTTYYLWLFPNYQWSGNYGLSFSIINAKSQTYTLSGQVGLVYIDTGSTIVTAIPFLDTGSELKQLIPYRDNGSGWDICG